MPTQQQHETLGPRPAPRGLGPRSTRGSSRLTPPILPDVPVPHLCELDPVMPCSAHGGNLLPVKLDVLAGLFQSLHQPGASRERRLRLRAPIKEERPRKVQGGGNTGPDLVGDRLQLVRVGNAEAKVAADGQEVVPLSLRAAPKLPPRPAPPST